MFVGLKSSNDRGQGTSKSSQATHFLNPVIQI